ncbi:MAG: hypothetical protein M3P23_05995, partial [Actinomycetota bacterium]|nr:hypothetical protein [Actinomycetota bacterium]
KWSTAQACGLRKRRPVRIDDRSPMFADPDLPLIFTRKQALQAGLTRHAVTWRASKGSWHALRRGAFCLSGVFDAATPEQRHLLTALAALAIDGRKEVLSHLSAALAYGFPGPIETPATPWFTVGPELRVPTRRRSGVIRQVAPLKASHVHRVGEIAITSGARTVADCLRHFPAVISVPIADAAVGHGVDIVEIAAILDWQESWPYAARGLASLRLVDGRRESWLESQSAVAHHRMGLPSADAQTLICDEWGRPIARVDFLWADHAVIGEADGWDKYLVSDPSVAAENGSRVMSAEVLRKEKTREDNLRSHGYEVVRWTTRDVLPPLRGLHVRLERAFSRGDVSQVRGTQHRAPAPVAAADVVPAELIALRGLARGGLITQRPSPYSSSAGDLA